MTTPRDDIAGLSERLREDVRQLAKMAENVKYAGGDSFVRVHEPSALLTDLAEAATQLDAQAKELAALREQIESCASLAMKEGGMRTGWQARAETAERGRDALSARVKNAIHDKNNALRLQAMLEAEIARLQQERDEAIKLIRPLTILAEDTARVSSKHGSEFAPEMYSLAARARSFVRRLASGPEKEKKE